jgi:hypothetical protein
VDIGPRVTFVMDGYSTKSFHIVTEEIPGAVFTDEIPRFRESYIKDPVRFCAAIIFQIVFNLEDLHKNNICHAGQGERSEVRIIDCIFGKMDSADKQIPDTVLPFVRWFFSSTFMFEKDIPIRIPDLEQGFDLVKSLLGSVSVRKHRLFVYPPPKESISLMNLLTGEKEESECKTMNFQEFLGNTVKEIGRFFFVERLDEEEIFHNRCLGELFGFSETKEEFDELCGLFGEDFDEGRLRAWIKAKSEGRDESEAFMSGIRSIQRLLNLNDLLISRWNQFNSMMTKFLDACFLHGIEVLDSKKVMEMTKYSGIE